MTTQEIKDIIKKHIEFYRDEIHFAETEEDYREMLGAYKAFTSLQNTIEKKEKGQNG